MSNYTVKDYIEYIRANFTDEQIMLAMELKTVNQAKQMLENPMMYPAFMTKHIHKLAVLTGHEMKMVL